MSEKMSRGACQRDKRGDLPKIREKRVPRKKHGEVSFPTQVRYDIVFFIRPLIVISALSQIVQVTCHVGKFPIKHQLVHVLTGFGARFTK